MKRDKLILNKDPDGNYSIFWYLAEEEDYGAAIGDNWSVYKELNVDPAADLDEYLNWKLDCTAFQFNPDSTSPCFMWDSKKQASAALSACNIALKAIEDGRPMPEWAVKSLEEGWKPPKGWKP